MAENPPVIQLEQITKRFGGTLALNNVSFSIRKGEVHAVVGENGAGKSTLMKMLAGIYPPDSGRILLRGEPIHLADPQDARRKGVSIVFQELNLFPDLTAAGNIFVNRELSHSGLLSNTEMNNEARKVFDLMGVGISPMIKVGKLSVGEKQLVEIARTLQQHSEIIIMDEPNSALTEHETEKLFAIIRLLRQQGFTIIYVSHRLEEVFSIADRITVLRDGQYQGTWNVNETSISRVITAMIGRRLEEAFPVRPPLGDGSQPLVQIAGLKKGTKLGPIDFDLHPGEILGFAGLEGSGVDDVFHILFGLEEMTAGSITYKNRPRKIGSPAEAIGLGWGLIPASRRDQGLMMDWSIRNNTTLVIIHKLISKLGLLNHRREQLTADSFVKQLNIATESIEKRVINLSGGNQQKVVVAKWLASGPQVLILNDPTRGVDVGAKAEIYHICDRLAREGLGLLFTSSEIDEILGLCDRVLVLYKGRIVKEFRRGEATKAVVMHWISGEVEAPVEEAAV
ncbi:MAG TPA: sugar ABC transporter ATP-binding protein [Anaerolineaceae bacterium]